MISSYIKKPSSTPPAHISAISVNRGKQILIHFPDLSISLLITQVTPCMEDSLSYTYTFEISFCPSSQFYSQLYLQDEETGMT